MKKAAKLSGARRNMACSAILAIVITVLFGFTMTACGDGAGGSGGGGGPTLYTSSSGIELVKVPAGTFQMGSRAGEPGEVISIGEETQHTVTLTKGFYIGKYEVTQAQYQTVIGMNPSDFQTPVSPETNTDGRPVEKVSWYDALVFCNKLSMLEGLSPAYLIYRNTDPDKWGSVPLPASDPNPIWDAVTVVPGSTGYRLPTEAQWEYACRAGTTTAFNWGYDYIENSDANYDASQKDTNNLSSETYVGQTTEVGSYDPNAWGLYDMHGNVSEWCWDWYGNYSSGTQKDPLGPGSGTYRVMRGGNWSYNGRLLRSAFRGNSVPSGRGHIIGFRIVRPDI